MQQRNWAKIAGEKEWVIGNITYLIGFKYRTIPRDNLPVQKFLKNKTKLMKGLNVIFENFTDLGENV